MTKSLTVMVVDDEAQVRTVLRAMLERDGYRVLDADSGEECLSTLARERCDAVLCDMFMPEMDGLETCRAILKRHPETKTIAMTGVLRDVDHLRVAETLGAHASLTKPFTREQLQAALTFAIEGAA